ncbi:MAG: autotransporter-associated beta strand repeat-containing protein [Planctomycetia bacterium]|nr:autotransporter-associated beta strand repeat-containing protein [Planctomycetia bacterium]
MKRIALGLVGTFFWAISGWGADVSIDGSTYTASNPYTVNVASADNYLFTNNGYMRITNTETVNHSGTFSGSGNLTVTSTSATDRSQIRFLSSMSGFTGTVNTAGAAWFTFHSSGSNKGSATTVWNVNSEAPSSDTGILLDGDVSSLENPILFGKLEGNGFVRPMGNQGQTHYIQVGHLLTNASDTSTFSGSIRFWNNDNVHVEKVGVGTWILSGTNDFTGGLVVSEGTVQMGVGGTTDSLTGGNPITVEKDGTFGYNRSLNITVPNLITVKGGGGAKHGKCSGGVYKCYV